MSRFQRNREAGEEQRATTLELFCDLVFVFAITQVSHLLLDDLSWLGADQSQCHDAGASRLERSP